MALDVVAVQETDIVLEITATDSDGAAIDLTGATITWTLRTRRGNAATITKTTGSGVTVTDAVGGVFEVTITDTDTASLNGTYYHEAKIVDSGGLVSRVRNADQSAGIIEFKEKVL